MALNAGTAPFAKEEVNTPPPLTRVNVAASPPIQKTPPSRWISRALEKLALRPDLSRAVRTSFAVTITLVVWRYVGGIAAVPFTATAAQVVCLPELRGAYHGRVTFLAAITATITFAALLGSVASWSLWGAITGMAAIAFLGAFWRHISTDYGPALAVNSALFYLMALGHPVDFSTAVHMIEWVMAGAAGAALLQICLWLLRPQYPLRHAVAECWVAASDLFLSLRADVEKGDASAENQVTQKQRALRSTLDRTASLLAAAEPKHDVEFLMHLRVMHRLVARLSMQVVALAASLKPLMHRQNFGYCASLGDLVLSSLANMARSAASTLITHRSENLGSSEGEIEHCARHSGLLEDRLRDASVKDTAFAPCVSLLHKVATTVESIRPAIRETVDRSTHRVVSPVSVSDLSVRSIRSLATWINPAPAPDPVLVRYSFRMAVLTMVAVGIYKYFEIPRGYWIALSIVVVLQPDYGSTRQRAVQRVMGTLGGSVLASVLLWIHLPIWLLELFTGAMVFGFAYFLRRRYGVAVFYITVMLVLLTESMMPVHLDFTIARLLSTLAGGGMALLAAFLLWPTWERKKFPPLMVAALGASRTYLEIVASHLAAGESFTGDAIDAKQRAERAENVVASSLQRMLTEPPEQQDRSGRAVALVTYNERIIRAITVLGAHLHRGKSLNGRVEDTVRVLSGVLERVESALSSDKTGSNEWSALDRTLHQLCSEMESYHPDLHRDRNVEEWERIVLIQIEKITAEIKAMVLAVIPEEQKVC